MARRTFLHREADLLADEKALSFLVENFAAPGLLTLLQGQTTAGKTQLALQFAYAVEHGATTIGWPCVQGTALYLDFENGKGIMQERLRVGAFDREGIRYLDMKGDKLTRDSDRDALGETVRQTESQLVILDSLRKLAGGLKEDSSDDMAPLISGLANVARDTGAAVVLLHNKTNKRSTPHGRGSSTIEDQADIVWSLDRNRDARKLSNSKMRAGIERDPVPLTLALDPLRFVVSGGKVADIAARICALNLNTTSGLTISGLAVAVGVDIETERRSLERAIRQAEGTKVAQGHYVFPTQYDT